MPNKIRYVSHDGREFAFDIAGSYKLRGTTSKDYEWDYAMLGGAVAAFSKKAGTIEMDVVMEGDAQRDAFYEAADSDVLSETPGRIYDGDFYREGFFVASSKSEWFNAGRAAVSLKFLPSGKWWVREATSSLSPDASVGGFDHPFDYAMDYATAASANSVTNDGFTPSPVRITVQGPAEKPAVTIAGNRYAVDVDIAAGQRLVIDGSRKTVQVISNDGDVTNAFSKRVGFQKPGSGEYVFEEVPTGESEVLWSGGFDVSVTVIEKRSEPRWA